jgi:uncharacterized protein YndB with AHSA1/START domain
VNQPLPLRRPLPEDQACVSVLVAVPPEDAFRIFTEDIDQWWRGGMKFRTVGSSRTIIHLEPHLGGRLFEAIPSGSENKIVETGLVTVWSPPTRLVFEWRAVNFALSEKTEVEVLFAASPSGTLVTLTHRGWSRIRPDHPARHGQEVAAFLRGLGMWWGDLMASLRERAEARES